MLNFDQGLRATRQGRHLHKYDNAITGLSGSHVVSTSSAIYQNIPEGKQIIIKMLCLGLETASDKLHAVPVGCSAVAGGGDATDLCHHLHVITGATPQGKVEFMHEYPVPLIAKYSDGYRSVSLALAANDSNAQAVVGWCGWIEDEGTLS